MGIEFEVKFQATQEKQTALAQLFPGPWEEISMQTTYYDTPDRILGSRKMTLRHRLENGDAVCTVKTPAQGGARGEWDCRCDDINEALPELCKLGGPEILLHLSNRLEEVCAARFTRRATMIVTDEFTAEMALDSGVLLGGGREASLCEVELELKDGDKDAMVLYAQVLANRFSLIHQPKSKYRRALDLAQGK
jgi:inorganic triphosphatase YgiF